MSKEKCNYYALLGIASDASEDEIKKAYRKLAHECHPDLHPNDPTAKRRFQDLSEAYEVLRNEETRRAYDCGAAEPAGDAANEYVEYPASSENIRAVGAILERMSHARPAERAEHCAQLRDVFLRGPNLAAATADEVLRVTGYIINEDGPFELVQTMIQVGAAGLTPNKFSEFVDRTWHVGSNKENKTRRMLLTAMALRSNSGLSNAASKPVLRTLTYEADNSAAMDLLSAYCQTAVKGFGPTGKPIKGIPVAAAKEFASNIWDSSTKRDTLPLRMQMLATLLREDSDLGPALSKDIFSILTFESEQEYAFELSDVFLQTASQKIKTEDFMHFLGSIWQKGSRAETKSQRMEFAARLIQLNGDLAARVSKDVLRLMTYESHQPAASTLFQAFLDKAADRIPPSTASEFVSKLIQSTVSDASRTELCAFTEDMIVANRGLVHAVLKPSESVARFYPKNEAAQHLVGVVRYLIQNPGANMRPQPMSACVNA